MVDLPTPLTPQNTTTKGFPFFFVSIISRRISIFFFGDKIWTNDSSMLPRTADATPSLTWKKARMTSIYKILYKSKTHDYIAKNSKIVLHSQSHQVPRAHSLTHSFTLHYTTLEIPCMVPSFVNKIHNISRDSTTMKNANTRHFPVITGVLR